MRPLLVLATLFLLAGPARAQVQIDPITIDPVTIDPITIEPVFQPPPPPEAVPEQPVTNYYAMSQLLVNQPVIVMGPGQRSNLNIPTPNVPMTVPPLVRVPVPSQPPGTSAVPQPTFTTGPIGQPTFTTGEMGSPTFTSGPVDFTTGPQLPPPPALPTNQGTIGGQILLGQPPRQ